MSEQWLSYSPVASDTSIGSAMRGSCRPRSGWALSCAGPAPDWRSGSLAAVARCVRPRGERRCHMADALRRTAHRAPQAPPSTEQPVSFAEPLLVGAAEAGRLCGRSEASWWRDHAAGRIPAAVKLGGRTLWRVEELRRWVEAGCPPRKTWEALRAQKGGGR